MWDIWLQISSEDVNTEFGSEQEAAGWKFGFNTKQNLLVSDLKDSTVKTKLNLYEQLFSPLPEKDLAFSELELEDKGTTRNNLRRNPSGNWVILIYLVPE